MTLSSSSHFSMLMSRFFANISTIMLTLLLFLSLLHLHDSHHHPFTIVVDASRILNRLADGDLTTHSNTEQLTGCVLQADETVFYCGSQATNPNALAYRLTADPVAITNVGAYATASGRMRACSLVEPQSKLFCVVSGATKVAIFSINTMGSLGQITFVYTFGTESSITKGPDNLNYIYITGDQTSLDAEPQARVDVTTNTESGSLGSILGQNSRGTCLSPDKNSLYVVQGTSPHKLLRFTLGAWAAPTIGIAANSETGGFREGIACTISFVYTTVTESRLLKWTTGGTPSNVAFIAGQQAAAYGEIFALSEQTLVVSRSSLNSLFMVDINGGAFEKIGGSAPGTESGTAFIVTAASGVFLAGKSQFIVPLQSTARKVARFEYIDNAALVHLEQAEPDISLSFNDFCISVAIMVIDGTEYVFCSGADVGAKTGVSRFTAAPLTTNARLVLPATDTNCKFTLIAQNGFLWSMCTDKLVKIDPAKMIRLGETAAGGGDPHGTACWGYGNNVYFTGAGPKLIYFSTTGGTATHQNSATVTLTTNALVGMTGDAGLNGYTTSEDAPMKVIRFLTNGNEDTSVTTATTGGGLYGRIATHPGSNFIVAVHGILTFSKIQKSPFTYLAAITLPTGMAAESVLLDGFSDHMYLFSASAFSIFHVGPDSPVQAVTPTLTTDSPRFPAFGLHNLNDIYVPLANNKLVRYKFAGAGTTTTNAPPTNSPNPLRVVEYKGSQQHPLSNFRQTTVYTYSTTSEEFILAAVIGSGFTGFARFKYDSGTDQFAAAGDVLFNTNGQTLATGVAVNQDVAFVVCASNPSTITEVDPNAMTEGVTTGLASNDCRWAVADKYRNKIYIACGMGGGPGRLIAFTIAGRTTANINFATDETSASSVVIDDKGDYAYVGFLTTPGRIVRIRLNTFERDGSMQLNAGENNVQGNMQIKGDFLYVILGTSPSGLVKINRYSLIRVGGLFFQIGEDDGKGLLLDDGSDTAFIGTNTAPMILVRVDTSSMSRLDAVAASDAGDSFPQSAVTARNRIFFATASYPGRLVEFADSATPAPSGGGGSGGGSGSGSNVLGAVLRGGHIDIPVAGAVGTFDRQICTDQNNGFVYAFNYVETSSSTTIYQFDMTTKALKNSYLLTNPNIRAVRGCARTDNEQMIFAGNDGTGSSITFGRFAIDTGGAINFDYMNVNFAGVASLTVGWMEKGNNFMFYAIIPSNTFSSVLRIDTTSDSTLVESQTLQLPGGDSSFCLSMTLGQSREYLYTVSSSTSILYQVKDLYLTMSVVAQIDLKVAVSAAAVGADWRMDAEDGFIYLFAQAASPPILIKVQQNPFVFAGSLAVGAAEGIIGMRGMAVDSGNNVLYTVGNRASGPSAFIRVDVGSMADYITEFFFENDGRENNATDMIPYGEAALAISFASAPGGRLTHVYRSNTPRAPAGEITPVTIYVVPTTKTNVSSPPPFNIEDIEGNIFYPMGYIPATCNNSQTRDSGLQTCVDQFHICYGGQRQDFGGAICPLTIAACLVDYTACLLKNGESQKTASTSTTTTSCAWGPAFFAAGVDAVTNGNDLYDCAVFIRTFAFHYYNCFPMISDICGDVVNLFAQQVKATTPAEIGKADLKQTASTKFPRGLLPIVIAKRETAKTCTRPYFTGQCRCPAAFDRMRLYEPNYLFATENETDKKAASNFDICKDRSIPAFENVSFAVRTVSAVTTTRRSNRAETSNAQCELEGQTLRELKVLAEKEGTLTATGRILASCAPRDTNIFILNPITGACYSPRQNVSCSCGEATSVGLPIVYLNETTNAADSGILIVCNFPLPPGVTTQQAVTTGVTVAAGLSAGPTAQGLQASAVVSLVDCQGEDSEAQQQGGRFALVPVQIGSSEAAGIIFLIVMIFGTFIGYFSICVILALFRYYTCCCNYCSGHDKAPAKYTLNPKLEQYRKLVEAHNKKKRAKEGASGVFASGVFENENEKTKLIEPIAEEEEDSSSDDNNNNDNNNDSNNNSSSHNQNDDFLRHETSGAADCHPIDLAPVYTTIFDDKGNAWVQKKVKKTVDEKMIITYTNEVSGEDKKKTLRKRFKYGHLDNKKLGFFYHLKNSFATMRFPGFYCFVILRIFYQGLAYESFYLVAREDPGSFTHSLGIFGCFLTVAILLFFVILGRALQLNNYCEYSDYKYLYRNWPEIAQKWVAPDGMWPDVANAYRSGLAWDDFSGKCRYLAVVVPLNYFKAVFLAALTAPPWSATACKYIYWVLIAIFLVFGLLLVFLRPVYRFAVATFTDAFLGFMTGIMLLLFVLEAPGQSQVYITIVYCGLVLAILNQVLGVHEFVVGFCVEVDDDEENNAEDWETDSENNDNDDEFMRRDKPKLKELVEEFRDDEDMQEIVAMEGQYDVDDDEANEYYDSDSDSVAAEDEGEAGSIAVPETQQDDFTNLVDEQNSANNSNNTNTNNPRRVKYYVPTPTENEKVALGGTLSSVWNYTASIILGKSSNGDDDGNEDDDSSNSSSSSSSSSDNDDNNDELTWTRRSVLNLDNTTSSAPDSFTASSANNNNNNDNNNGQRQSQYRPSAAAATTTTATTATARKPVSSSFSTTTASSTTRRTAATATTKPSTTTAGSAASSRTRAPLSTTKQQARAPATSSSVSKKQQPSSSSSTANNRKPAVPTSSSASVAKKPVTAVATRPVAKTISKTSVLAPTAATTSSSLRTTTTKTIPKPVPKSAVVGKKEMKF